MQNKEPTLKQVYKDKMAQRQVFKASDEYQTEKLVWMAKTKLELETIPKFYQAEISNE